MNDEWADGWDNLLKFELEAYGIPPHLVTGEGVYASTFAYAAHEQKKMDAIEGRYVTFMIQEDK